MVLQENFLAKPFCDLYSAISDEYNAQNGFSKKFVENFSTVGRRVSKRSDESAKDLLLEYGNPQIFFLLNFSCPLSSWPIVTLSRLVINFSFLRPFRSRTPLWVLALRALKIYANKYRISTVSAL